MKSFFYLSFIAWKLVFVSNTMYNLYNKLFLIYYILFFKLKLILIYWYKLFYCCSCCNFSLSRKTTNLKSMTLSFLFIYNKNEWMITTTTTTTTTKARFFVFYICGWFFFSSIFCLLLIILKNLNKNSNRRRIIN